MDHSPRARSRTYATCCAQLHSGIRILSARSRGVPYTTRTASRASRTPNHGVRTGMTDLVAASRAASAPNLRVHATSTRFSKTQASRHSSLRPKGSRASLATRPVTQLCGSHPTLGRPRYSAHPRSLLDDTACQPTRARVRTGCPRTVFWLVARDGRAGGFACSLAGARGVRGLGAARTLRTPFLSQFVSSRVGRPPGRRCCLCCPMPRRSLDWTDGTRGGTILHRQLILAHILARECRRVTCDDLWFAVVGRSPSLSCGGSS